ncbi:uncharacterized protein LAESUDRAFT_611936, partial [Laetiporus sulphureus 93-53]
PYTRWLGFWLDPRLTFRHHVRVMTTRAISRVQAFRMLANTIRGMSVKAARTIYLSNILSVLTFG